MEEKGYDYFKNIKEKFLVLDVIIFRFGSIGDGGYYFRFEIIKNFKVLFSGGVLFNVEFEYDIFCFNKDIKMLMFDFIVFSGKLLFKGFVRFLFFKFDKIRYFFNVFIFIYLKRNLRCIYKKIFLNKDYSILKFLRDVFKIDLKILLKFDIEGSEFDFLDEIFKYKEFFIVMVFEFYDMNKKYYLVEDFIEKC